MDEDVRLRAIEVLRRGEPLPPDWAQALFPPERREYELVYYGKEREEDILANTMGVPLQPVRSFGKNGKQHHNMLVFGDNLQVMKTLLRMACWKSNTPRGAIIKNLRPSLLPMAE